MCRDMPNDAVAIHNRKERSNVAKVTVNFDNALYVTRLETLPEFLRCRYDALVFEEYLASL